MTKFTLKSLSYHKNILKITKKIDILNSVIIYWYKQYSFQLRKFGNLAATQLITAIIRDGIKLWMYDLSKLRNRGLNDIRKIKKSNKSTKYSITKNLKSEKKYIKNTLNTLKHLTYNDSQKWENTVNRFKLKKSHFPNINQKYWLIFKYLCAGKKSEHCNCTHIGCGSKVIYALTQDKIVNNSNKPICNHLKFGELIDKLIYILEKALENINEMENERKYLVYAGHRVNNNISLLSKLPIEIIDEINKKID